MEVAKYELRHQSALNRLDLSSVREGALVKVGEGYGCVHPWPELGDTSLPQALSDVLSGRENPLSGGALRCVERFTDGSLFSPPKIDLKSHATLPRLTGTAVTAAVKAGFTTVKVKRGKDWMRMRKKTAAFFDAFPQLRWRFDFNGALSSHRELYQFLSSVPSERVDFIEDPFSDVELVESWRGFPIGYDRVVPKELDLDVGFLIAKPAIQSRDWILEKAQSKEDRVIFTSYMDHPLGQLFAYTEACHFYAEAGVPKPPLCGLVTHHLYESTPYSSLLGATSPEFHVPTKQEIESLLLKEQWTPTIT